MSLLQCDQCKNILKDPIFIPCGYSICKHHIDESTSHTTPCSFCNKVHQDPFVDNQKVSRLLDILNRAKDNTNKLADETQEYEKLKQKPNDFVNSRFDELKKQVEQERDRIVEFVRCQVDLEAEKCASQIEHHRERCLNLLDVKPPSAADFFLDHSDINAKLAKFNEFLVSNKISEDIWDEIYQQTSRMFDQVKKKIATLQESYMARAAYRFESSFDYSKKIPFGRLMIESNKHPKANGTQNGAVSCISISPPIQREKSPNPMCNNSQTETEVQRIVSVSQLQTGSASNQTASGQQIQVRQPIQNTTQNSTNNQVQTPQNQLKQPVSSPQIQARQKSPNSQQTGQQNLSKQTVSSQQIQVRQSIQNTTQNSPQQQTTPQNQVKQNISNQQIQARPPIQNTTTQSSTNIQVQSPQNQLKHTASSQQIQAKQKSPNNQQQITPQNQVKQTISNQQIQARQSTQNSPNNQQQTTPQNQLKQPVKLPTQNSANNQTQQQQQTVQTPQKQTSSGQQTPTRQPIQTTSNNQPQTPQQQQTTAQINNQSLTLPISSTAKTIATPPPLLTTAVQQNGVKFAARKSTNKPPNGSKIDGISAAISRNKSQIEAKRFKRILGHVDYVYCVCFDRTGEYIFTGSDDKLVKMWRAKDGMLVYTLRGHTKEIGDLDINYENTVLASGGNDKKVMCWNVKTAQLIYINTHYQSVSTVKFSPYCQDSTRWLISTGNDGILSFLKYHHNPNSSTSYDFYPPIDFQVYCKIVCSSFSTGGNFLAIGTIDKQIGIYYILKTHPILIAKLPAHNSEVNSIMFSNKSACFLSGSKDGTVKVWNVKAKKWTSSLIELETGKNQTYCNEAVWNCDDSLVITAQRTSKAGSEHHCIKIWSPSGALKHVLNFHTSLIYIIKPHPTDPKILLSASQDGYVVLWNIFTGQMLFSDYNEIGNEGKHGGICDAKWSPKNAEIFASTDSHGHLSIFGFGPSIPESYSSTPAQLFFHTDYDLMCKERNTIVDKRTKIPPNFMPYGYLTDYMRNPMPLEAQRLVPTHETLKKDEFDKLLVRNPDIEGKFVIDDGLSEIAFQSANLSHKDLIQPLNETLLKESEALRLESAVKEEEFFKAEFNFADLIKDGENNANKRRERVQSSENGTPIKPSIDDLDASSSSLESLSKLANKRKKLCEDELIN